MSIVAVSIDASQLPAQVENDLLECLRLRAANHKFHYATVGQTEKRLALHEAYSPARTDTDCLATYELSFAETTGLLKQPRVDLISLGCGGDCHCAPRGCPRARLLFRAYPMLMFDC